MPTPQQKRLLFGNSNQTYTSLINSLSPSLWYRHQEASGTIMLNSGSLSPNPISLPTASPAYPPVTAARPTPALGTDMNMEAGDTSAWTATTATLTKETGTPHGGSRCLRVKENGATAAWASQAITLSGKTFHVVGWARSDGTAIPKITGSAIMWTGTTSTDWQPFDFIATWDLGGIYLGANGLSIGGGKYVEFDDITVTEYRPVYNLLTDGNCEAVNTGAWTATGSATLSKQTTLPHSGTKVLRIARNGVNNPGATQACTVTGRTYHLTGWMRSDGNATPKILSHAGLVLYSGTTSTDWQAIDIVLVNDGANLGFYAVTSTGTQFVEFDDLVLTEYYPSYFSVGADMDMEAVNTQAWSVYSTTTLTKQTGTPHSGTQCLRVAHALGDYGAASQGCLIPGKVYRIRGYARSDGTILPRISLGSGSQCWTGTNDTNWQAFDVQAVSDTNSIAFWISTAAAGGYAEFDDIQVTLAQPNALIQDGDMEVADRFAWTTGNSATITKQTGTPHGGTRVLRIAYNGTPIPYARQTPFVVGRTYQVTGWARSDGNLTPSVSSAVVWWQGTTSTSWQQFSFILTPTATSLDFRADGGAASQYVEFDDIVVTELSADVIPFNDGDMERLDPYAWTTETSATLTKQAGTPHGGSRCLRVTSGGIASGAASQTVLVVGRTYRVTGWARGDGTNAPNVTDNSVVLWTGTGSTSWQLFDITFTSGGVKLRLRETDISGYCEFDDITVIELATGSTALLGTDMNMEAGDTSAWSAQNSATLSKQGSAHSGSQCLRILRNGVNTPGALQSILTANKSYRFTGWFRSDGNVTGQINVGGNNVAVGTTSTSWQYFDFIQTATTPNVIYRALATVDGQYVDFDDLTVREDFGNGTYTAMTLGQTGKLGPVDAVLADGSTSLSTVLANKAGSCRTFTCAFLCKPTSAGEGNNGTLLYWGDTSVYIRFTGATGTIGASRKAATTNAQTITTDVVPFGEWVMIFVTFDDNADRVLHIYLGWRGVVTEMLCGATKNTAVGALTDMSGNALTLYNYADASKTWAGNGDEGIFIPRLLTLPEMQTIVTKTGV